MPFLLSLIMAMSILVPAVAGVFRFRSLLPADRWFVVLVWVGTCNEIASIVCILFFRNNIVSFNWCMLLESLVVVNLFAGWSATTVKRVYVIAAIVLTVLWLMDNLVTGSTASVYGFFNVSYSLMVMYLCIKQMTRIVTFDNGNIFYNGRCIASATLLLFYSIKTLTESFYVFDLGISVVLSQKLVAITSVINVLCNFLFAYAIICFRKKEKFTLEFL